MQSMAVAYGGVVGPGARAAARQDLTRCSTRAGASSRGCPRPFTATRYHSLAVEPETVPDELRGHRADARTGSSWGSGTANCRVEGVQFHPESVLTEYGHRMLANWLAECGDPESGRPIGRARPGGGQGLTA